jgi:ornithine cyclodeaminase/alanine dehydrogenase-like protein (mu-crystallin family)
MTSATEAMKRAFAAFSVGESEEITIFKSAGLEVQDLVAAAAAVGGPAVAPG